MAVNRTQWPLEVHGMDTIVNKGINVTDISTKDLLVEILLELRKMNLHLSLVTDENIKEYDLNQGE